MKSHPAKNCMRIATALISAFLFSAFTPVFAATITVNSFDDDGVNGNCSLREAIIAANTDAAMDACEPGDGADEIILSAGTYTLSIPGTDENLSADGDLDIVASDLTITGADPNTTIIDGNGAVTGERVFTLGTVAIPIISVVIRGVTIQGGQSSSNGGGILNYANTSLDSVLITGNTSAANGGGIHNFIRDITITDSIVSTNTAATNGGGIYNQSSLSITNSIIRENIATTNGGGGIANFGSALTITNSNIIDNSANNQNGGGITNFGTEFTITNSLISGNNAVSGGGINAADDSSFELDDSIVSSNTASNGNGGGINIGNAQITINRSSISENSVADGNGGGIYASNGLTTILSSTINANTASGDGGGIHSSNNMTVRNITISENASGGNGGGIWAGSGTLRMDNVTLSNNTADNDVSGSGDGGGLFNVSAALEIRNTLIAGNNDASPAAESPDCAGDINSLGNNLLGDNTGCNFLPSSGDTPSPIDPLTSPLADNGGPTQTHALQLESPAIDAGNNTVCGSTDQRGITRPQDGNNDNIDVCDIGAYELDLSPDILIFTPTNDLQVAFGDRVFATITTLNVTVNNEGLLDLNINRIGELDPLEEPFAMASDCFDGAVPPAGSCTIQVQFAPPSVAADYADSFEIVSTDPDESLVTIDVTGSGVISLNNTPPTAPVLVSPVNNAEGVDGNSVTFSWERATDINNDIIEYSIIFCTIPNFSDCSPVLLGPGTASLTDKYRQDILYAGLGTSGMLLGIIGFITGRKRHKTQTALLLLAIVIISPLLTSCEIGVDDIEGNFDPDNQVPLSVTFSNFDANTRYYWRVFANDNQGGNTPSEVRNFRTQRIE